MVKINLELNNIGLSASPQRVDEHIVVLFGEVFVQLALGDPREVVMWCPRSQIIGKECQAALVMCSEEVRAHSCHTII